jgi:hypothetical protein
VASARMGWADWLALRHMPVVRRVRRVDEAAAPSGGLEVASPGEDVSLLYVYDFVKLTQMLLGVEPRPLHEAAVVVSSRERAESGDNHSDTDDGASVHSLSTHQGGKEAALDEPQTSTVYIESTAFSRLEKLFSALQLARSCIESDNYMAGLEHLNRPLLRSTRLLEAARAITARQAAASDSESIEQALISRASLVVSLSLTAQAKALQGVLLAACGGRSGTSDAVNALREASSLLIESLRTAVVPDRWAASLRGSPRLWRATDAHGAPSVCVPCWGRLLIKAPEGASALRVSPTTCQGLVRIQDTLGQQCIAGEDFETCGEIIQSLGPAQWESNVRDMLMLPSECPVPPEWLEQGEAVRRALAAALTRALLDRSTLVRAVIGDAARGAFRPAGALGRAVSDAREAFVMAASGSVGGALGEGTWASARSSHEANSELMDAEGMATSALRICSQLVRFCGEGREPEVQGILESLAGRASEYSALSIAAVPRNTDEGAASQLRDALSTSVPVTLQTLRASTSLCMAALAEPASKACSAHVSRAKADLSRALSSDSAASMANCLLAAALYDEHIGPLVTTDSEDLRKINSRLHASIAFGASVSRVQAMVPRLVPTDEARKLPSPCEPDALRGVVSRAPPELTPAVRELVRIASAASAIARLPSVAAATLVDTTNTASSSTATAAPAAPTKVQPSLDQLAELDDILAAMQDAGAL